MKKLVLLVAFIGAMGTITLSAQASTDFITMFHAGVCATQKGNVDWREPTAGVDLCINPEGAGNMFTGGIGMGGGQFHSYRLLAGNEVTRDSSFDKKVNAPVLSGMVAWSFPESDNKTLSHFAGPMAILEAGLTFPEGFRLGSGHMFGVGMQLNYRTKGRDIQCMFFVRGMYKFGFVPKLYNGAAFTFNAESGVAVVFRDFLE